MASGPSELSVSRIQRSQLNLHLHMSSTLDCESTWVALEQRVESGLGKLFEVIKNDLKIIKGITLSR